MDKNYGYGQPNQSKHGGKKFIDMSLDERESLKKSDYDKWNLLYIEGKEDALENFNQLRYGSAKMPSKL